MRGQFIIVHKTTGNIMHGKQGVYTTKASANRALAYWVRKEEQSEYIILDLEPKTLLSLMS